MWLVVFIDSFVHIIPQDDLQSHEENTTCACHPTVTELEHGVLQVKHNSYDHREYLERLTENICLN